MYQFASLGHQACGHQSVFENQLSAGIRDSVFEDSDSGIMISV